MTPAFLSILLLAVGYPILQDPSTTRDANPPDYATQAQVNQGAANDLAVSPLTLANATTVLHPGAVGTAVAAQKDARFPSISIVGTLDPTGVAQSTGAIQAALDSVPATGGTIHLPAGRYWVEGLMCANPVRIEGEGTSYMDAAGLHQVGTVLFSKSSTGTTLTLRKGGTSLESLSFVYQGTLAATAGSAFRIVNANDCHFSHLLTSGFYDSFTVENGLYYTFTDCSFRGPVNTGGTIQNYTNADQGDPAFTGCTWGADGANGQTALLIGSGGGVRLVSCKINSGVFGLPDGSLTRFQRGVYCHMRDNAGTSDLFISACSFENIVNEVVKTEAVTPGGGFYDSIVITGNEFGYSGKGIDIDANAGGEIAGNYFVNIPGTAITLRKSIGMTVGTNTGGNCGPMLVFQPSQEFNLPTAGVNVAPQIRDTLGVYVDNLAGAGAAQDHVAQFEVTSNGAPASNQVVLRLAVPPGKSSTLDFFMYGANGAGRFRIKHQKVLSEDNVGGVVTVLGSTADAISGPGAAGITPSYDATTVPGFVFVKLTSPAPFAGTIRAKLTGAVAFLASGADPQGFGEGAAADANTMLPSPNTVPLTSQNYGAILTGGLTPNVGAYFKLQALDNGNASDLITMQKSFGAYYLHFASLLYVDNGLAVSNGPITSDGYRVTRYVPAPASSTAAGTPGDVSSDGQYFYFFTGSTGGPPMWKRAPISSW